MVETSALDLAIKTVSDKVLREVFSSICKDVPEANAQAEKYLLAEKTTTVQTGEGASSSKTKVIAPRYVFCQNCEKEFATDQNSSTSCRYHPELSQRSEKFDEEIEEDECHPYDSDDYRNDFPDLFEFPCCKETLEDNPHGCKYDWHVEGTAGTLDKSGRVAKKARVY